MVPGHQAIISYEIVLSSYLWLSFYHIIFGWLNKVIQNGWQVFGDIFVPFKCQDRLLWAHMVWLWAPYNQVLLYPPLQRSWKGGILVSPCPSVRLSVCGQNRVRSVSSTILIGSISYLHIWCDSWNFGEFFKFVILTLSYFDLLFLVSFLRCHCRLQFRMDSFHIWYKWSIAWEGVSHVMTFNLDLYLQGHSALT